MIFQTQRLTIRPLKEADRTAFFDMMSNYNVMSPIPQPVMDKAKSDANFEKHLNALPTSDTKVMAIEIKNGNAFIGICAYLKNNNNQDEIGYRLIENFWGVGYGTETTKGLIDYAFNTLNLELLTADVNTANVNSVKILDKFFTRDVEFYNEEDQFTDRRHTLKKEDWK
jgi:ribosomal-protein-alanine N-acetyltransferase